MKDKDKRLQIAKMSSTEIQNILNIREQVKSKGLLIFYYMDVQLSLYILSTITFPHESYTRYPTKDLSPKDYNLDLGIVNKFPELIKLTNFTFKLQKNIMESEDKKDFPEGQNAPPAKN